jgi:hypothetical protein
MEQGGLHNILATFTRKNTLIAFIRHELDLSGYDVASTFKAKSYGDCIDHTRAAQEFLLETNMADVLLLEGVGHPAVLGQNGDHTYALLVRDLATDSWWFWKASPPQCLASLRSILLPPGTPT